MKKIAFLFVAFLAIGYLAKAQEVDSLKQYTGKYIFPDGNVVPSVEVSTENGKLNITSSQGTTNLERLGVDSFSIVAYQGTCKFVRNADKKIVGVIIEVMSYHLEGTKEAASTALLPRNQYLKNERKQFAIR